MPLSIAARFILSAPDEGGLPREGVPEFCLLGRSNVGKSSFINHLFGKRSLARVSKHPGKTIFANYYRLDDGTAWIDMPGYGYARISAAEVRRCSDLITACLDSRPGLAGIIWLLDSRHAGTAADLEALRWIRDSGKPVLPVCAKFDKLPRSGRKRRLEEFRSAFGFDMDPVPYSIRDNTAPARFWERYGKWRKE